MQGRKDKLGFVSFRPSPFCKRAQPGKKPYQDVVEEVREGGSWYPHPCMAEHPCMVEQCPVKVLVERALLTVSWGPAVQW